MVTEFDGIEIMRARALSGLAIVSWVGVFWIVVCLLGASLSAQEADLRVPATRPGW